MPAARRSPRRSINAHAPISRSRRAALVGARDGFGVPAAGLVAALSGYGVMARETGLDFGFIFLSVVTVWTMPALMAFVELLAAGGPPWLMFATLLVINFRNLPMSVSAIPMIRERPGFRWHHLLMAQLLSPTSWVQSTVIGRTLSPKDRMPYYTGFSLTLLAAGLFGVWVGFSWTEALDPAIGLSMLLLTPLFVLLIMSTSPKRSSKLALMTGCVLVPPLMHWDAELGLILGGIGAGTLGYLLARVPGKRGRGEA